MKKIFAKLFLRASGGLSKGKVGALSALAVAVAAMLGYEISEADAAQLVSAALLAVSLFGIRDAQDRD